MADKSCFVNTGSTAGGDGTTNATVGVNRAYVSLAAAELAERRDLTTLAGRMIFNCTGTAADTAVVSFATANWPNPTSAFYILIQANPGQEAVMPYSTTRYRLEPTTGYPFSCDVPFTRLFGLQAKLVSTDTGTSAFFLGPNAGGGTTYVERCFAHVNGAATGTGFNLAGVDNTATLNMSNCVAYNPSGSAITIGFQCAGGTDNPYNIYNCTAYGFTASGYGFNSGGTSTKLKNCLAAANNIGYNGTFGTSNNNASSLADAPGTSNRNSQTFTFINTATGDLHITSSDAGARTFGANLSADATYPITVDFDGTTRPSTWDIGATQITAAAGAKQRFMRPVTLAALTEPDWEWGTGVRITTHARLNTPPGKPPHPQPHYYYPADDPQGPFGLYVTRPARGTGPQSGRPPSFLRPYYSPDADFSVYGVTITRPTAGAATILYSLPKQTIQAIYAAIAGGDEDRDFLAYYGLRITRPTQGAPASVLPTIVSQAPRRRRTASLYWRHIKT